MKDLKMKGKKLVDFVKFLGTLTEKEYKILKKMVDKLNKNYD